jgi:hypothetical protein
MPTLRIVYLTEQQYAGTMDHAHAGAANTTAAEGQLSSINQEQTRLPIADATRNASSNKPPPVLGEEKKMAEESDHEEDNDYLDTLLQEAIDGVNDRRSFGGHAVRHQQVQQEMVLSSDEESENDSSSSERVCVVLDAVQQFQHEMVSSDEKSENSYSTPSAQVQVHVDAVQQKSGNKRKRSAPIQQSFDDRCFNDLMVFKAKYGHSLGQWCSVPRVSCNQIQNNQMPQRMKLSELSTGIVAPPGMSIKDSTSTRSRNLLLSIKHMNTRGLSDSMKRSVRSRNLVNEAANTRTSYSQHMGVLLNSLERRTKEQYDAL